MSGFLELRYSESSIKRFQKEILSQRIARLFFSMSFVNLKRETLAVVDTAEYVPIIAVESISFEKAVLLLISIIEKMFETENRYFYIGEYRIASKYIMYDPGTSDAVLLYSPFIYKNRGQVTDDIAEVLILLSKKIELRDRGMASQAYRIFRRNRGDLKSIYRKLNRLYYDNYVAIVDEPVPKRAVD